MKEFKLVVAGGRDFTDYAKASNAINELANGSVCTPYAVAIVSGMARGADAIGAEFARTNNVKLYEFPADWDVHGKRAGFIRNEEMGRFSDGLLAFWDGQSLGTKHMIEFMKRLNKPVFVVNY